MSSPFLTIPRARSMIWPGSQQTIGELLDQDKLSCKTREYIDGGNLPRNIDEAVAVKVADNGGWATIRELWYRHNGCMDWNRLH